MRVWRALGLTLFVVASASCGESVAGPPDFEFYDGPRLGFGCDSGFENFCDDISDAISQLEDSPNSECQRLGALARARYGSTDPMQGYFPGDPSLGEDSYTYLTQNSSGDWVPTQTHGGKVYVVASAWSNNSIEELAWGMAAHEEQHLSDGWAPNHGNQSAKCTQLQT